MAVILPDIRFLLTVVVCRFSLYRDVELVPSFIQMKRLCECFVSNATRKGNKIIAVGVKCLRSSFSTDGYRGKCSSPPDEWTTSVPRRLEIQTRFHRYFVKEYKYSFSKKQKKNNPPVSPNPSIQWRQNQCQRKSKKRLNRRYSRQFKSVSRSVVCITHAFPMGGK